MPTSGARMRAQVRLELPNHLPEAPWHATGVGLARDA